MRHTHHMLLILLYLNEGTQNKIIRRTKKQNETNREEEKNKTEGKRVEIAL